MVNTHTFEIQVNGTHLNGFLDLSDAFEPKIETDEPLAMPLDDLCHVTKLVQEFAEISRECGTIETIEVKRIPTP